MWHTKTLTMYIHKKYSIIKIRNKNDEKSHSTNSVAILTVAQGGTCAIIKTECCVYIPDNFTNVSPIFHVLHSQINAVSLCAMWFND